MDAEAKQLFDRLGGPKVWDYYPESSHCEFLPREPEKWRADVQKFIAALPAH